MTEKSWHEIQWKSEGDLDWWGLVWKTDQGLAHAKKLFQEALETRSVPIRLIKITERTESTVEVIGMGQTKKDGSGKADIYE